MVPVDARREELVARMPVGLQQDLALAELLILKGLVPKALDTPEKLLMVWQRGRELGLPDSAALRLIFVTPDGSLGYYASLMQALFQRAGGRVIPLEVNAQVAHFRFVRKDGTTWEYGLTMEEAKALHYHEQWRWDDWDRQLGRYRKEKGHWEVRDAWHNHPADMLAACAMRKGLRLGGADALIGLAGMVEADGDDASLTDYDPEDERFVTHEEAVRRAQERERDRSPIMEQRGRGRLFHSTPENPTGMADGFVKCPAPENEQGEPGPIAAPAAQEGEYREVEEQPATPAPKNGNGNGESKGWATWTKAAQADFCRQWDDLGLGDDTLHAEFGVASRTELAISKDEGLLLMHILGYGVQTKSLTLAQLHGALGVSRIIDWLPRSAGEAHKVIDAWIAQATKAQATKAQQAGLPGVQ